MSTSGQPSAVQSLKKQVLHFLQRNPTFSNSASTFLRTVGYDSPAVKIAIKTGNIPLTVPVHLRGFGNAAFKMGSQGGKDLIAANLWFKGWKGFEFPLPDVFAALCAAAGDSLVLDVGANTGFYSLIATSVNKGAEVHAFEPFPPVHKLLMSNLQMNAQDRVRDFAQAVSDSMGTTKLYVPLQDHGAVESSCSLNPDFKESHSAALDVPQVTIDEHVRKHSQKRVSVLKIDVEGFEDHVLAGAVTTLTKHRPNIVLEILPKIDLDRLNQLRRQLRYTSYKFKDGYVVREQDAQFDNESWNHLWLPEESPFPTYLGAFAAT